MPAIEPTLTRITNAIAEANQHGLLAHDKQVLAAEMLNGYSGNKLLGALQRICRLFADDTTACYLEIGVFQGLTLNSVASATPSLPCFGIDNFAFFDPERKNLSVVNRCIEALGNRNAHLLNADYEDALETLGDHLGKRKIAVYFVDGPHDYRSQLMCLELALPHLHERAVIVVDDANYEHVRQANADFLRTHKDWLLLAQAYTPSHPDNMATADALSAREGWWNGVNILGRDPEFLETRTYPPTRRSRAAFETDHFVHPHRMAPFVEDSLSLTSEIANRAPLAFAMRLWRMVKLIKANRSQMARFESMNTDSEDLPSFLVAPIGH